MILGVGFLVYGAYIFIQPEASIDLLGMSFEEQNNDEAYITMGIGLFLTLVGVYISKVKSSKRSF